MLKGTEGAFMSTEGTPTDTDSSARDMLRLDVASADSLRFMTPP
jgi:hypothetical protein